MPLFQVSSRVVQSAALPEKRTTHSRKQWSVILRIIFSLFILTLLATLAIHTGFLIFLILLPVCTGIIMTRSQLSNLLQGTLVYGGLTICLALVYFGGITGLQLLVHTPGAGLELLLHSSGTPVIIVVTTTLFMAVLFEPLRVRAQAAIEHYFNRRANEAARVIEAFTATLREEIDLNQLRKGVFTVIQQTMQPRSISVWTHEVTHQNIESLSTSTKQAVQPRQVEHEERKQETQESLVENGTTIMPSDIAIADSDPFMDSLLRSSGAMSVDRLRLNSPLLSLLQTHNAIIALPLVNQGELIGLLTLGCHLNGEEYTRGDLTLLNTLASQVAPALHVALMVQEQQTEVREHERSEQELRTARNIQRTFLPKDVPALPGWQLVPYYQPAREVGGDFYDFLSFPDGCVGLVIGDVTDKGIPAALVMTATRTMIRTAAQEQASPCEVFARVNDLLASDIPTGMFVTCFYALLNPQSGRMRYVNAGQDLPYLRHNDHVSELYATGMPLGMMPGTRYEEHEVIVAPGESILFYSDGLVEAHNARREMFDTPRLKTLLEEQYEGKALIDFLLRTLKSFTGEGWEQEDDVTLVTLQRMPAPFRMNERQATSHLLQEWTLASVPGNEQQAMEQVADVVRPLHLPSNRLADLKTAVAEAVMNAMEHGNQYQPEKVVKLQVFTSDTSLVVHVCDQGEGEYHPIAHPVIPDLEAKLAGRETPRGWGLFLIKNLVDELHITNDEHFHMVEMAMYLAGVNDGNSERKSEVL